MSRRKKQDEPGTNGAPVRWTMKTSATLLLPNSCRRPARIRVTLAGASSMRNLEGLTVSLEGRDLPVQRSLGSTETTYEALVPADLALERPILELAIGVDRLHRIPGRDHRFGVAVSAVTIDETGD